MKTFLDENFLLETETAQHLYHDYVKGLPIIDYHCHLSPKEIYEDISYDNITQVWLGGDHYKWRQMRSNGVEERCITGDAPDSAHYVAGCTGIDRVHARLLPENKLSELQNIRRDCGPVMFVGDGINDAPVLAGADVGAAMGSGADAAIEAADVVFMGSEMSAIPEAVEIARSTRRIAWQNVYFALGVKLIVMLMCLAGHANMWIAVFADTGVSMLCLLNAIRLLRRK